MVKTVTRDADVRGAAPPPEAAGRRALRGAAAGFAAGFVFIAVTAWFASTLGDPAEGPLRMISTIVKGENAMATGAADPVVGAAVHVVLSIAFGVIFGLAAPLFGTNGSIAAAGVVYGGVLYLVNFLLLSPIAFPVFQMANQPFEVLAHVVFGVLLSFGFFSTGVRRAEPRLAFGPAR